ncbi:hypothetical protein [Nocardia asiatica]|uniref:hypothetical protein n=1 Tax=Nocardia asiatica TaxID=209252 RepID=UPI00245547EC|nr:hypothetical protein [Nocardia asiatica]
MSGEIGVYIDMLERAAANAGDVGDKLSAIAVRLRDATAVFHGVWGDDHYGEQFAKTYVPARDALVVGDGGKPGALPGLAKIFHQIGDAEQDGAEALRKHEDRNKARFR